MLGRDLLCRRQAGAEMAAAALGGMEWLEHFQELGVTGKPARFGWVMRQGC